MVAKIGGRKAAGDAGGRPAALLKHYEKVAEASRHMLAAALVDDWPDVMHWQRQCLKRIADLRRQAHGALLRTADNRRRLELLRGILSDDAEIRTLVDPGASWIDQLLSLPSAARGASRARQRADAGDAAPDAPAISPSGPSP